MKSNDKLNIKLKEIRLELEEAKLNQILMELDVLHQSNSDFIVDFYGAFFTDSCVYYCMEYMDAGSLDKLYGKGVPEEVLAMIIIAVGFSSNFFIIKIKFKCQYILDKFNKILIHLDDKRVEIFKRSIKSYSSWYVEWRFNL